MRNQPDIMTIVWTGREPLTSWPEVDYAVMDWGQLVYWPPPSLFEWGQRENWGVFTPFGDNLRFWRRMKRLRSAPVQRRLTRRIIQEQRSNDALVGERARNVKLKDQDVIEIRTLYHSEGLSFNKLARRFDVSTPTIAQIVKGVTWTHLPLDPAKAADAVDPVDGNTTS